MNKFNYQTKEFQLVETIIKGSKKFYIEGYISTIDKDDYNEVVTINAQKSLLKACLNKTITMDVEHDEFIDNGKVLKKPKNTRIPVAKIVNAELKSKGVWVKAELNQSSDRFKNIKQSIVDGFLHSFSIAFNPIKTIVKSINGVMNKFIDDLTLINVTLTGSPVNTNATFVPVMKAVVKTMEENNENKIPIEENKEVVSENKENVSEVENKENIITVEDLVDNVKKIEQDKINFEQEKKEFEELKIKWEEEHKPVEKKEEINTNKVSNDPLTQIKSLSEEIIKIKKQNVDLKAKLNTPILKSKIESSENIIKNANKLMKQDIKSPLDFI